MCHPSLLLSVLTCSISHAEDPFYNNAAPDGSHTHYIEESFYDLYIYNPSASASQIMLRNNPDAILSDELSSIDDIPELRLDLDWEFKFYGHLHDWISISPNGFLTTHPVSCITFCNWWADSGGYRRYIAPLMADFDASAYVDSTVYYLINNDEKYLEVQWYNITLWQPDESADGEPTAPLNYTFDFQTRLLSNGTIYFTYFYIPVDPRKVAVPGYDDRNYSANVGLEDAAYQRLDSGLYEIYPYAPIVVDFAHLLNKHTIVFEPKETCSDQISCLDCMQFHQESTSDLECGWCPTLQQCSDGLGREIFEYESADYCTDDELVTELDTDTCTALESDVRQCELNQHVLARYPQYMTLNGNSQYYSGVITELNYDGNTFEVDFDSGDLSSAYIQYSWVSPCSSVSYQYSSNTLPAVCTPHCAAIYGTGGNNGPSGHNDSEESARKTEAAVGAMIAIIVVICGIFTLFMYRGRRRRRYGSHQQNMAATRGIHASDDDEDSLNFPPGPSPANSGPALESANSEHSPEDEIEMQQELQPVEEVGEEDDAVHMDVDPSTEFDMDSEQIDEKPATKGWDMTPLN